MKKAISFVLILSLFFYISRPSYPQASGEVLGWKERTSGVTTYPYQVEADFTDNNDGTISLTAATTNPAGSNTQVQFNDNGLFGADPDFTWNKTSNILTVPNIDAGIYKSGGLPILKPASIQNTYVGVNAGAGTSGNNYDTLVGYEAGYTIDSSNGRGEKNVFVGAQAGYGATGGTDNLGENNTGVGYRALYYLTTGYENTALGFEAMHRNTSGNWNTAVGRQALWTNQSGHYNVAIGFNCMDNHSPSGVVAIGYEALGSATGVDSSVVIGYRSAYGGAASGDSQTIVGYEAGYKLTTGTNNTYYGWRAGYNNQTGSSNIFLGYLAGYSETGSNKLYIENSESTAPLIYGEFNNDLVKINGSLYIPSDTKKLYFGASNTWSNYTNGTNFYINRETGSGSIILKGGNTSIESTARPELQIVTTGAAEKNRVFSVDTQTLYFGNNLYNDGVNWLLDNTSQGGAIVSSSYTYPLLCKTALAGTGPRTLTTVFSIDTNGIVGLHGVTSDPVSPQDGSIWYREDLDEYRCRANNTTYRFMLNPV